MSKAIGSYTAYRQQAPETPTDTLPVNVIPCIIFHGPSNWFKFALEYSCLSTKYIALL